MKHSWVLCVMSVLALAGTAGAASTLYAATSLGPFKSTDSGVTWNQLIVTTNDSSLPGQPKIFAIVVDPRTPSTVYAMGRFTSPSGFPLAFLKSTDSGANWSVVSKPTFSYTSGNAGLLAIDAVKTNVLYTMAADEGLEVTTDGGVTWTAPTIPKPAGSASRGTPNQPGLDGVAADPNHSGVVYVVGGNLSFHPGKAYLLKSSDFGNTFGPFSRQRPALATGSLSIRRTARRFTARVPELSWAARTRMGSAESTRAPMAGRPGRS